MSPRASGSSESAPEEPAAPDINQAMEATAPDEARPVTDPPGSEELTTENVRRYPHLFTDEQKATISTDELPETEAEKAQREAAEAG